MILLETDRLILRELFPGDAADLFELDSDPEVHRYLGGHVITNLEQSQETITKVRKQYLDYGIGRLAIERKDTGECIGWAGLKYETAVRPGISYYDLGYRLKRRAWGQGFATEAALASLAYGFDKMNLSLINAAAHVDNGASNHILTKIGMEYMEQFSYDGGIANWYRITRDQWQNNMQFSSNPQP